MARLCCPSPTLSNKNISKASCPNMVILHKYHHWGRGLSVLILGQSWSELSVSMATKRGKYCLSLRDFIFNRIFTKFAINKDGYKILDKFDSGPDPTVRMRVTCPFRHPSIYNWENVVWLMKTSFLIGYSSNLQITRTCIKPWISTILAQF